MSAPEETLSQAELDRRIHELKLSAEAFAEKTQKLESVHETLRACIRAQVPAGREQAIALTKVDEAELWAGKGLKAEGQRVVNELTTLMGQAV